MRFKKIWINKRNKYLKKLNNKFKIKIKLNLIINQMKYIKLKNNNKT